MRIVEARYHAASVKLDHAREGTSEAKHLHRCACQKNPVAVDGDGFGLRLRRILRPDVSMHQHQAGVDLGISGRYQAKKKDRAEHQSLQHSGTPAGKESIGRSGGEGQYRWNCWTAGSIPMVKSRRDSPIGFSSGSFSATLSHARAASGSSRPADSWPPRPEYLAIE